MPAGEIFMGQISINSASHFSHKGFIFFCLTITFHYENNQIFFTERNLSVGGGSGQFSKLKG